MGELLFTLKCLAMTILIAVLMQVKVGTTTIESRVEDFCRTSTASSYLQSVAAGAVMGIKEIIISSKRMAKETIRSVGQGSREQAIK